MEGLENEKQLYDDLILTNSIDSYDNLTLKTMATLEWIDTYCNKSKYILKTDDDMFIHVPNLLKFIRRIKVSTLHIRVTWCINLVFYDFMCRNYM